MPTLIFKVDCGELTPWSQQELQRLENKVQEALTEVDYNYLVYRTEYVADTLFDQEDSDERSSEDSHSTRDLRQ